MYYVVATFDVSLHLHREFIAAALEDSQKSRAEEGGTKGFDLIKDEAKTDRFFLIESYDERRAFEKHLAGPYAGKFLDRFGGFEVKPPLMGYRIEEVPSSGVA